MHESSVLSLRIDSKDLEKLQKEAHRSRLALNSFIRQVLLSYLEWERPALDGGMLPVRKKMLRALLEYASEEQLARIAAEDAEAAVDEMYGRNDLDSFLSLTRLWMQKSGFTLAEHFDERGGWILVGSHDMGRNWSSFFGTYNKRVVQKLGQRAESEATDDLWIVRIRPSD